MLEILVFLALAVVAVIAVLRIMGKLWALVVNALLGLLTIWLVNTFDLLAPLGVGDISITPAVFLVCLFGGIPGAVIILLLAALGIVV